MDGLILIDKPQGATSHDIVLRIRKTLGLQKVGHFGTLDPLATGLLLLAVGKATGLFPFYSKKDKVYRGKIRLGFSTDTYDALGTPMSGGQEGYPDRQTLVKAMNTFVGKIKQVPPPYSAKKFEGKPLYKWARAKRMVHLEPSAVAVYAFDLIAYSPPFLDFESRCSAGTYVRSLAHDLGQCLGCGGHLVELRRLAVGGYDISAACSLEQLKSLAEEGQMADLVLPLETLLPEFPKVILKESGVRELQKGKILPTEHLLKVLEARPDFGPAGQESEEIYRLFSPEGEFLALAKKSEKLNGLLPFLRLS